MGPFISDDILRLIFAVGIGMAIGAEREYSNKSAGLRTMTLVTAGACIFTIISLKIGSQDRIAANIITGIGFLGAGAIFKEENKVSGLTTATAIWLCAALGMAAGGGYYMLALAGSLILWVTLYVLKQFEVYIDQINRIKTYKIGCTYRLGVLEYYEKIFEEEGLKPVRLVQVKENMDITCSWKLSGSLQKHDNLVKRLLTDPGITELSF